MCLIYSRSISLLTSCISGTLDTVTFSPVRSTAASICSASFLAPCGVISPRSLTGPCISKASIIFPEVFLFLELVVIVVALEVVALRLGVEVLVMGGELVDLGYNEVAFGIIL